METQMKQRVVGILVLLLLVVAIASLLLYGLKQNEKVLDPTLQQGQIIEAASDKEVQLSVPGDNKAEQAQLGNNPAVQISQTPRDVIKNITQDHAPVVSNNFGQVDANDKKDGQNLEQLTPKSITQDGKSPIVEKVLPASSSDNAVTPVNVNDKSVAVPQANPAAGTVPETAPTASDMLANDAEKNAMQSIAKTQSDTTASPDNAQINSGDATKITSTEKATKKQVTINKIAPKIKAAAKTIKIGKKGQHPAGKNKPVSNVGAISHGWSVKFGSFVSPPNAAGLVSKLRAKGYHVYTNLVVTATQGVLTQVFVGPVATQVQAIQVLKAVQKNLHITGTIVQIAPKAKSKVKVKPVNNKVIKPAKIIKKKRNHNI